MKHDGLIVETDGMAGICPSLVTDDDVVFVGKVIDELPLAFIAELGADDDGGRP